MEYFCCGSTRALPIDDWNLSKNGEGGAEFIPCWSASILLDLIPWFIEDKYRLRIDKDWDDFSIWYTEINGLVSSDFPDITKSTMIDACYEIVCWLLEHGYLKKGE